MAEPLPLPLALEVGGVGIHVAVIRGGAPVLRMRGLLVRAVAVAVAVVHPSAAKEVISAAAVLLLTPVPVAAAAAAHPIRCRRILVLLLAVPEGRDGPQRLPQLLQIEQPVGAVDAILQRCRNGAAVDSIFRSGAQVRRAVVVVSASASDGGGERAVRLQIGGTAIVEGSKAAIAVARGGHVRHVGMVGASAHTSHGWVVGMAVGPTHHRGHDVSIVTVELLRRLGRQRVQNVPSGEAAPRVRVVERVVMAREGHAGEDN